MLWVQARRVAPAPLGPLRDHLRTGVGAHKCLGGRLLPVDVKHAAPGLPCRQSIRCSARCQTCRHPRVCCWPEGIAVTQLNTQRLLCASTPLHDDHIQLGCCSIQVTPCCLLTQTGSGCARCCCPGPGVLDMQRACPHHTRAHRGGGALGLALLMTSLATFGSSLQPKVGHCSVPTQPTWAASPLRWWPGASPAHDLAGHWQLSAAQAGQLQRACPTHTCGLT